MKGKVLQRGILITTILVDIFLLSCTSFHRRPIPVFTGSFQGNSAEGDAVLMSFEQEGNTIIGNGSLGGRKFSLSGIASWHGPVVVMFEDGTRATADLRLSVQGDRANVKGLGRAFDLNRVSGTAPESVGPFTGTYTNDGPPVVSLELKQEGTLLSGTGIVEGKPVAVVGIVSEAMNVRGILLFSDESERSVKATLSDGGRELVIHGLGGEVVMRRR